MGHTDGSLLGDISTSDVARVCYALDQTYSLFNRTGKPDIAGILPFEDAPPIQRDGILAGVKTVLTDRNITPAQFHQEWVEFMKGKGWTRGATTNESSKQSALLVPYHELQPKDQIRALLFIATVNSLMVPLGTGTSQRQTAGVGVVHDGY
jgi:hypothetical protein